MKRFVAFLFLIGLFALVAVAPSEAIVSADRVCVVAGESIDLQEAQVVQTSGAYYITLPINKLEQAKEQLKSIKGYVYYFNNNINRSKFNSFFDFKFKESKVGDIVVWTGYTSSYKDYRIVNGKKVNIQLAFTKDEVIVGYPLILTGF